MTYEEDRTLADGRRQQAHRSARRQFAIAREGQLALWQNSVDAVTARLDRAKIATGELPEICPDDPTSAAAWHDAWAEYAAAQSAMVQVEQQLSDRPLRDQLGREIDAADRSYYAAEDELRRSLGISPTR